MDTDLDGDSVVEVWSEGRGVRAVRAESLSGNTYMVVILSSPLSFIRSFEVV